MSCAPTGRGLYVWSQYDGDGGPPLGGADMRDDVAALRAFDFVAIEYLHSASRELALELERAGVPVYGFSGPDSWEPSRWGRTVDQIERWCDDVGARGYFADPEDAWPGATDAQARELGRRLADAGTYVALTSYPLMPRRHAFAAGAAGRVDGSPQLYPQAGTPAQWAAWFADWRRLFGRCIPSLSVHRATAGRFAEPAQYRAYLRAIPTSRAVIGWSSGALEGWRQRDYLTQTNIDPLARIIAPISCYFVPLLVVALVVLVVALLVRSTA